MTEDEEEMQRLYGGINMSNHQEVFTVLFTKVPDTTPDSTWSACIKECVS